MGTGISHYDSSSRYDPSLYKVAQLQGSLSYFCSEQGGSFLGREIDIPNEESKHILMMQLQRKILLKHFSLLNVQKFMFRTDSTLCSQVQKCVVLCQRPNYTLAEEIEKRRQNRAKFTVNEVKDVITHISSALTASEGSIFSLDEDAIVMVNGKVCLIDPLILEGRDSSSFTGKYPSPESVSSEYGSEGGIEGHLFSLGIICLEMVYSPDIISKLYVRSSVGKVRGINFQLLQHLIQCIPDERLRNQIQILTRMSRLRRKDIFHDKLIKKTRSKTGTEKVAQKIASQSVPLQQINQPKTNVTIKVIDAPKTQSITFSHRPVSVESRPQKVQKRPEKRIDKENVNPNTVIQSKIMTPKKPIVKHEFSTIKEVTEYDMSERKNSELLLKQFEGEYEGNYKEGARNGFGKCVFPEGGYFQGEWTDNKMDGFGRLFYPNGQLAYEGNWSNNEFQGKGKVFCMSPTNQSPNYMDLNSLENQWVSYQGNLQSDKREGQGTLIFGNGDKFEGNFKDDVVHGEGKYFKSNGTTICGVWREGLLTEIL